jgi:hypothetical protein
MIRLQGVGGLFRAMRALFSTTPFQNGKPPAMKRFDPLDYGLTSDFVLTNFTKMKG